jgi:protein-tyrosine phosphatase
MTSSFRILVVGVGNDCRSALAERHLRHQFDNLLGDAAETIEIASAGVRALQGAQMGVLAALELERMGGTPKGFTARQLRPAMMQEADLVLTVTRALRSRVLEDEPAALKRTFSLREFAALSRLLPPHDAPHDFVAQAAARRWAVGVAQYDVADPAGGNRRKHRQVADQIDEASKAITGLWSRMLAPAGAGY